MIGRFLDKALGVPKIASDGLTTSLKKQQEPPTVVYRCAECHGLSTVIHKVTIDSEAEASSLGFQHERAAKASPSDSEVSLCVWCTNAAQIRGGQRERNSLFA